jgi:hypothetical protein
MARIIVGVVGGFVLVFIESYIIMVLKDYRTIEFGGISPFINVWAMNFFLLFSILTHFKIWYEEKNREQEGTFN